MPKLRQFCIAEDTFDDGMSNGGRRRRSPTNMIGWTLHTSWPRRRGLRSISPLGSSSLVRLLGKLRTGSPPTLRRRGPTSQKQPILRRGRRLQRRIPRPSRSTPAGRNPPRTSQGPCPALRRQSRWSASIAAPRLAHGHMRRAPGSAWRPGSARRRSRFLSPGGRRRSGPKTRWLARGSGARSATSEVGWTASPATKGLQLSGASASPRRRAAGSPTRGRTGPTRRTSR